MPMKLPETKRKTSSLLVLLLFGIFALCILSVLLTGTDAYRRLARRDDSSYDRRTAVQYLSTRVRQADAPGGITVEEFEGVDALVLSEEIGGVTYETRVYCYDGYLRELFCLAGGGFLPEDGEKVLPADALTLSVRDNVLSAALTDSAGDTQTLLLYLRSGGEGSP